MLTRFHKILIAALAVQLVLAVILLTRGDQSAAQKEHPIVAGFDAAQATRVQVFGSGEGAKPIDLVKKDKDWVMASGFDYPVAQAKVTDVLSPIAKLAAAAPIATQTSRHKQLKVADNEFERKLVITSGGKDLTLFIGAAAGARRTAVRLGGDDNVYAATGLSTAAIATEPRLWVDPSYVKVAVDDIAKVTVKRDDRTLELAREAPPAAPAAGSSEGSGSGAGSGSAAAPSPPAPEHWMASISGAPVTPAAGETLDEPTITRLIGQAANVEVAAPADPKRDASKPTATITIDHKASGTSTAAPTVVDVIADGNSYWVHDRSQPRAVMVDKVRIDDLLNADRDKLIKKPPPPAPAVAPGAAGPGPHPGMPPGMPGMPGMPAGHPGAGPG